MNKTKKTNKNYQIKFKMPKFLKKNNFLKFIKKF